MREAATIVDNQMTRIKNGLNIKGIECVVVMITINIAPDLLSMQRRAASDSILPIGMTRAEPVGLNARTDEVLRQYGEVIQQRSKRVCNRIVPGLGFECEWVYSIT